MWKSQQAFEFFKNTKAKVNTLSLGQKHERAALKYLKQQGLNLKDKNVRFKAGEIDLIMTHQQQLVFVEVRFRNSESHGGALASVDRKKQQKLIKAAQLYLQQEFGNNPPSCRFDVVAVDGNLEILWIKNAFC